MKRTVARTHLWIGSLIACLVALVLVGADLAMGNRIEQHRQAQVQLSEISALLERLGSIDRHVFRAGEVSDYVGESSEEVLHSLNGALDRWQLVHPLTGPDCVQRIDRAAREYLETHERVIALYKEGLPGQAGSWYALRVRPARDEVQREVEAITATMEEQAEAAHIQHDLLAMGGGLTGLVLFLVLLWQLNRAGQQAHRLELEQQLLDGRDRLMRAMLRNVVDGIAIVGVDGRCQQLSAGAERMFGYGLSGAVEMTVRSLVHPEDLSRYTPEILGLAATPGAEFRAEFRVRHADGVYRYAEIVATNLVDDPDIKGILVQARDVAERKLVEDRLAHLAYHDELTQLPNRAAFVGRLEVLLREAKGVGVLFLDLDNFKMINDSLGIEAGDAVLRECARRLREALPQEYQLARFEGDKFAAILEETADEEELLSLCERLTAALDQPVRWGEREAQVTLSLGLALQWSGGWSVGDLVRQANLALHCAKQQGKSRLAVYDTSMETGGLERLQLDADLRRAVRQGRLELHYQPIVSLESGLTIGVEALVRWHHPLRGWVPPAQFIPLAEQGGYIDQLGQWVLEEACREGRRWLDRGLDQVLDQGQDKAAVGRGFTISVNLSPLQFQRSRLVEEIAAVLEATGLSPHHLTLEITETTLMKSPTSARAVLQRLKSLGIHIAIDDFGTGHSSLSYLKKFPVDILKIDRSFVSGLGSNLVDRALARTVINLARALEMTVTAEGVESAEQVAELRELGCDRAQGYFFGRPVRAADLWQARVR